MPGYEGNPSRVQVMANSSPSSTVVMPFGAAYHVCQGFEYHFGPRLGSPDYQLLHYVVGPCDDPPAGARVQIDLPQSRSAKGDGLALTAGPVRCFAGEECQRRYGRRWRPKSGWLD